MFGNPGVGSIGKIGVVGIVDGVDEPLAPLPVESRTLPDLILGQELNNVGFKSGVVGGEKHAHSLFAGKVLGLVRRTGLKYADEMLEGVLAGGDSFGGANSVWNMAFKFHANLLWFVMDSQIRFTWKSCRDL